MSAVQTIVVAYDDPESRTLARAADLAQSLNATLIVTNVVSADRESQEGVAEYSRTRLDQLFSGCAHRLVGNWRSASCPLRTISIASPRMRTASCGA